MKITLKTLQGKQLPIELEEDMTIADTKKKIEEEHKMAAESQKLIAYGKVLADEAQTLRDYNIKDGDFIVVMVQKAKPKPKEPAPADKPQNTTAPLNVQAQQ
jgi:selenophosphate synthetase-related protein